MRRRALAMRTRRASQENQLVPAAREILGARRSAREHQYKADSKFTQVRRRAALMGCIEHLEQEQLDPTFGEVSRKLQQEGWQMDEVQEHLLLLAEDPEKFNITSGRELLEVRAQVEGQQSLSTIDDARGGDAEHVDNKLQVRRLLQDFKNGSDGNRAKGDRLFSLVSTAALASRDSR
jgi:hypothetical protein